MQENKQMEDDQNDQRTTRIRKLIDNSRDRPLISKDQFQTKFTEQTKSEQDWYFNKFKDNQNEISKLRKAIDKLQKQVQVLDKSEDGQILKGMKMPTFTSYKNIDEEAKEHRQTTWQDAIKIFKKSALAVILEDRTAALDIYRKNNSTIEEELRIKLCTLNGSTSTFNEHYLLRGINEAMNAFRDRIQNFTYAQQLKTEYIRQQTAELERKKEEAKAEALNDPNTILKMQFKRMLEDYNKSKNAQTCIPPSQ